LVGYFLDHGGDLEPFVLPLSLDGILGKPVEQPECGIFERLKGLTRGYRVGWGVGNRMLWERIESGRVQGEWLEKANTGQAVKIEQVGVTRGVRIHGAGTNKTDDTGSNPIGGRWRIDDDGGWQRVYAGLEGQWDWDGREDWLAGVGVLENGEEIVCKWPRDWDREPCGREQEERVGEREDWQALS
jgi:hypothetical protein